MTKKTILTRQKAEEQILKKCKEIKKIVENYNPEIRHFSMFYIDDFVSFNNQYFEEDENRPLRYFGEVE